MLKEAGVIAGLQVAPAVGEGAPIVGALDQVRLVLTLQIMEGSSIIDLAVLYVGAVDTIARSAWITVLFRTKPLVDTAEEFCRRWKIAEPIYVGALVWIRLVRVLLVVCFVLRVIRALLVPV